MGARRIFTNIFYRIINCILIELASVPNRWNCCCCHYCLKVVVVKPSFFFVLVVFIIIVIAAIIDVYIVVVVIIVVVSMSLHRAALGSPVVHPLQYLNTKQKFKIDCCIIDLLWRHCLHILPMICHCCSPLLQFILQLLHSEMHNWLHLECWCKECCCVRNTSNY